MEAASNPLRVMNVSHTGDMPTWSTYRDTKSLTPNDFTLRVLLICST